jgi:hypothetical protein
MPAGRWYGIGLGRWATREIGGMADRSSVVGSGRISGTSICGSVDPRLRRCATGGTDKGWGARGGDRLLRRPEGWITDRQRGAGHLFRAHLPVVPGDTAAGLQPVPWPVTKTSLRSLRRGSLGPRSGLRSPGRGAWTLASASLYPYTRDRQRERLRTDDRDTEVRSIWMFVYHVVGGGIEGDRSNHGAPGTIRGPAVVPCGWFA